MEAVSMQDLYKSNGRINWWGWIFFFSTLALVVYSIYECHITVKKMNQDEDYQTKKMMELEMNIREIRGDQYKSLNLNNNNNKTNL